VEREHLEMPVSEECVLLKLEGFVRVFSHISLVWQLMTGEQELEIPQWRLRGVIKSTTRFIYCL